MKSSKKTFQYIFGPVFSRRLGHSLGVDLLPYKICTFDCVYCECGPTTEFPLERKPYVPTEKVISELDQYLQNPSEPIDYITFTGNGEPTLHSGLGEMIHHVKERYKVSVAVLTNGSLLWDEGLREELSAADLVVPSLDAVSETIYRKIDLPHRHLPLQKVLQGIYDFCKGYSGEILIEILFVKNFNDQESEVQAMAKYLKDIPCKKIQIHTIARPPAYPVQGVSEGFLEKASKILGLRAEIIHHNPPPQKEVLSSSLEINDVLGLRIQETLRRRPSPAKEISNSFQVEMSLLKPWLRKKKSEGEISSKRIQDIEYWESTRHPEDAFRLSFKRKRG